RATGPVDPNERIEVTLLLRGQQSAEELEKTATDVGGQEPGARRHTTREEFARAAGTSDADIATVEAFAHEHGLDVVEASPARRSVVLSGSAADLSRAFRVELQRYESAEGAYRGRTGPVNLPASLDGVVLGV